MHKFSDDAFFTPSLLPTAFCPMMVGLCIKTIFLYSNPLWRKTPVHQTAQRDPCSNVFESNSPLALIGLVLGERASLWCQRNQSELIEAIVEQYARLYETDEKPTKTFVQYWPKESLTKGCYAALYPTSPCSTWRQRNRAMICERIWLASAEMDPVRRRAVKARERFASHFDLNVR